MSELKYVQGIFKEELKNRFLCLVEINGKDTLCYIPSSCRLSNFIDLAGRQVILIPVASANSRTDYSVYALRMGKQFVLLNMSQANRVIEDNIGSRRFAFLGRRKNVRKEHTIENYKCDIYIEDTRTVVEIKSILSFEKETYFPTVYSQRAIDQLAKICNLLDKGYRVCYIFVSLNSRVRKVSINDRITGYRDLFQLCIDKGMELRGFTLRIHNDVPFVYSNINIVF